MKIRTDFVTNSSSSSFTILIGLTLTNGSRICFQAEGGTPEDRAAHFVGEAIASVSPKQLGAAKSVEELLSLLSEGVYDSYNDKRIFKKYVQQKENTSSGGTESKKKDGVIRNPRDFITAIRCRVSDMDQIQKITIGGYESNYANYNRIYTYNLKNGSYSGIEEGLPIGEIDGGHGGDLQLGDLHQCEIKHIEKVTSSWFDWDQDNKEDNEYTYKNEDEIISLIEKFKATISPEDFEVEDGILTNYWGDDKYVAIPNSITAIGDSAFDSCESLTAIRIPDSVSEIGVGVFNSCCNLTSIIVDSNNKSYSSQDGVLFNKDKTVLICYPEGKPGSDYFIPNSVLTIGSEAFCGCTKIMSIMIPNSVSSIGDYAFSGCKNLESITIPNSITTIGDSAFGGCESLTDITIPNSITSIGRWTFSDCTNLANITIPDGVTNIGEMAFSSCHSLKSVSIPDSVVSIAKNAFMYCVNYSLKSVHFQSEAKKEQFQDCFGRAELIIK